jgi:hypothetical protein
MARRPDFCLYREADYLDQVDPSEYAGSSVMSKRDEYRAHATLCQRRADESTNEDDKLQWLSMAQSWIGLIQVITSVDGFNAEMRAMGIDQEESRSSH